MVVTERRKLRVGVLFGGRSSEHEVSLMSARSVLDALDRDAYEVVQIGVTKEGRWLVAPDAVDRLIERAEGGALAGDVEGTEPVALVADPSRPAALVREEAGGALPGPLAEPLDVVFPLIHGRTGEDGALQGLLDLAHVAYVGAGVTGSAVGMDKAISKAVWRAEGLPVGPYLVVAAGEWSEGAGRWKGEIATRLGFPCFVKPANSGSSIGVTKVHGIDELEGSMEEALAYDAKALVEGAIVGRELEVAVLGNDEPEASVVGEVVPGHEFYDYEDKYFDDAVRLEIPADLPEEKAAEVRDLAIRAFRAVDAAGMARVDFFLAGDGTVYLNEINTIPGFTKMSMYPRLWDATGVPFGKLCDRLIALAVERRAERDRLRETR
ncbi:MAG: D-alanine--D-alanine ligase [Gemmatimonadetes bacterium]|nr:D-alanine--D-alanine ligase [Gemmatimonadota bacterium]